MKKVNKIGAIVLVLATFAVGVFVGSHPVDGKRLAASVSDALCSASKAYQQTATPEPKVIIVNPEAVKAAPVVKKEEPKKEVVAPKEAPKPAPVVVQEPKKEVVAPKEAPKPVAPVVQEPKKEVVVPKVTPAPAPAVVLDSAPEKVACEKITDGIKACLASSGCFFDGKTGNCLSNAPACIEVSDGDDEISVRGMVWGLSYTQNKGRSRQAALDYCQDNMLYQVSCDRAQHATYTVVTCPGQCVSGVCQ